MAYVHVNIIITTLFGSIMSFVILFTVDSDVCTVHSLLLSYVQVRKAKPKDSDAKAKYEECSRIVRQHAFEKAIRVDSAKSVVDTLDWEAIGERCMLVVGLSCVGGCGGVGCSLCVGVGVWVCMCMGVYVCIILHMCVYVCVCMHSSVSLLMYVI